MRGDVYRLKAPRGAMGNEQSGTRYAVVVQSDDLFSSTMIVVPTSLSARRMGHRPEVTIKGQTTNVLVEQIMAVDPRRLGELVGRLPLRVMQDVDQAIRLVLAID